MLCDGVHSFQAYCSLWLFRLIVYIVVDIVISKEVILWYEVH